MKSSTDIARQVVGIFLNTQSIPQAEQLITEILREWIKEVKCSEKPNE